MNDDAATSPESITDINFSTVRRGYDPDEVKKRLATAAAEVRRLSNLVDELRSRVADLEGSPPEQLEAQRVAEALGDEAARLLQSARDAAQERIDRAEAESEQMLQAARDAGREVVQEAKEVRQRMLSDLAEKKKTHRSEVAQLRVVRDRALQSLAICRQGIDEWIGELMARTPNVREAVERAGLVASGISDHGAAEPSHGATADEQVDVDAYAAETVGLYDVEAEPEETERGDDRLADDADGAAYAGDIFARLRAVGEASVAARAASSGASAALAPARSAASVGAPARALRGRGAPDASSGDQPGDDDLLTAARRAAVAEISRVLKRMVVDEQGELLDALRRVGPRALDAKAGADSRPYSRVVRRPLEDFASDIDVSIDDIDLRAAGLAVIETLVRPLRTRLRELAAETDDLDELSTSVRALYRESRSRRADAAAEEAFVKGWSEPVA